MKRGGRGGSQKSRSKIMRPEVVTEEHLSFLDRLRESGITNMFGASPYLEQRFGELAGRDAVEIVTYWMESFGREDR
jgi:hypothetical protein